MGVQAANLMLGAILLQREDKDEQAVECFRTAHEFGLPDGTLNLGIYQSGRGVPKDLIKANSYFEQYRSLVGNDPEMMEKEEELIRDTEDHHAVASCSAKYDTCCSICTEVFDEHADLFTCPCKHAFHRKCLTCYFQHYLIRHSEKLPLCPNCRAEISLDVVRECDVTTPDFF
jgi:hypothetical protein